MEKAMFVSGVDDGEFQNKAFGDDGEMRRRIQELEKAILEVTPIGVSTMESDKVRSSTEEGSSFDSISQPQDKSVYEGGVPARHLTENSSEAQQQQLPPGFRFHPTDEELTPLCLLNKCEPKHLPDNSCQLEEAAFVPIGSPAYTSKEVLLYKPLSPRLYEGDDLWSLKMISTHVVHRDMMSLAQGMRSLAQMIRSLFTGVPLRNKLTPVEEEAEIRKSIVGAYQTIMKRKVLTVSRLNDIWCRIKMLEEDMQASQDKPLSPCGKYRETIGSLKTEFRFLLSFAAPNLRDTNCQLHALMREVDRGRDLERAGVLNSYGSNLPKFEVMHTDKVVGIGANIVETKEDDFWDIFIRNTEALRRYPSSHGWFQGRPSMPSKEIWNLKDRMSGIKIRYCQMNGGEIGEVRDIWNSIKRLRGDVCFYRKHYLDVEALISIFISLLRLFISNEMLQKDSSDFSFKEGCRQLLRDVHVYADLDGAWTSADSVGHASSNGGISTLGKMKAESNKDPLLPQKNNQARELEDLSNFAFLGLIMCYAVLYFLYSAFIGKMGSNTRVMIGLHIWTALLMLLLFIGSFIRFSVGTLKIMRLVMSGLLFVSSSLVFILLQLSL